MNAARFNDHTYVNAHRDHGGRPPDVGEEERDHRNRIDNEDEAAPTNLRPDPSFRPAVEDILVGVRLSGREPKMHIRKESVQRVGDENKMSYSDQEEHPASPSYYRTPGSSPGRTRKERITDAETSPHGRH